MRQINVHGFLEHADHERFGHIHDLLLIREAHFDIHLSELGLAVGAQILVAETTGDLKIAIKSGHHAELLELLR